MRVEEADSFFIGLEAAGLKRLVNILTLDEGSGSVQSWRMSG